MENLKLIAQALGLLAMMVADIVISVACIIFVLKGGMALLGSAPATWMLAIIASLYLLLSYFRRYYVGSRLKALEAKVAA